MQRATPWLWLALGGSVLQLIALGSNFYVASDGELKDAWLGIPHTSDLIFLSAIVAIGLFAATALGRNPIRGRNVGLTMGIVGLLAALQLGYRMIVPPFGGYVPPNSGIIGTGCLYFCLPSEAEPAELLAGIWIGFVGCLAVTLGGLLHAFSRTARETPARPWIAPLQSGMTPWLGLAALGAVGQFVFGYTFFTFYRTVGDQGETAWSGWLPTPHTSSLVLAVTLVVIVLVWLAARVRSPLNPAALGGLIAVSGFVSASRIFFRIIEPPFGSPVEEIGVAAYLSLLAAALVLVSGIVHTITQQKEVARASVSDQT